MTNYEFYKDTIEMLVDKRNYSTFCACHDIRRHGEYCRHIRCDACHRNQERWMKREYVEEKREEFMPYEAYVDLIIEACEALNMNRSQLSRAFGREGNFFNYEVSNRRFRDFVSKEKYDKLYKFLAERKGELKNG